MTIVSSMASDGQVNVNSLPYHECLDASILFLLPTFDVFPHGVLQLLSRPLIALVLIVPFFLSPREKGHLRRPFLIENKLNKLAN